MKELSLSPLGRLYVFGVIAIGCGLVLSSMVQLGIEATPPYWVIVATLAVFSAPLSLRLPSLRATVTVSETFVFAAAILFGPAAATLTVALDGFFISFWSKRRNVHRTLFNIGEPAISIWVASQLFYWMSGIAPLFDAPVPLATVLVPLLVMTTTYFLLNGLLSATAMWFETRVHPLRILRDQLPHTGLNFFATCSFAVLLVLNADNLTFAALGVLAPLLVLSYVSSKLSTTRAEESNTHLNELSHLYLSTIEALAMAIDAKDQVTSGHIRRVQVHSIALARELGIADEREIKAIEAAALLHDLGKLAVPEYILNKPGKLTASEFEQMKTHAAIGADILASIDFPYPVEPIVRYHHEMWNGQGYPEGISGNAIPIGARILSVVDCYDALTSDRPYRRALTPEQAVAVLAERRGSQYDPRVVDTFIAARGRLMDASDSRALSEAHVTKEADIREVVLVAAQDVDEPVAHGVLAPSPQLNDDGCVLLTLQAIAHYLETEAPDSVAVVYTHDIDRASLTASHVSSAEHEFLLRGVSMALGERLSGWVGANRQTMVNSDPALDLGDLAGTWTPRLRGSFAIPLMSNDTLLGVLTIYTPNRQGLTPGQIHTVTVLVADGLEPMSENASEPLDAPAVEAPAPVRSGPRAIPSPGPRRLPVSA
jgi:putative nucleotidyltransferase with HDIG domain